MTLPAQCTRSGSHLLDNTTTGNGYHIDCPGGLLNRYCYSWFRDEIETGTFDTQVWVSVGDDSSGKPTVVVAICGSGCEFDGTDGGVIWSFDASEISHWDELDGLLASYNAAQTDQCPAGRSESQCTGTPDDALIEIP